MLEILSALRARWADPSGNAREGWQDSTAAWRDVVRVGYLGYLDREPGEHEYGLWEAVRAGPRSVDALLHGIQNSEEARRRAEARPRPKAVDPDSAVAVAMLYRVALGRDARPDEVDAWLRKLRDGLSFGEFVQSVVGSDEATRSRPSPARGAEAPGSEISTAIATLYRLGLGRDPGPDETEHWSQAIEAGLPFTSFVADLADSEEARTRRQRPLLLPDLTDGAFIRAAYEVVHRRGPVASEMDAWDRTLRGGGMDRQELVGELLAAELARRAAHRPEHDQSRLPLLGSQRQVTRAEWDRAGADVSSSSREGEATPSRFPYLRTGARKVSIISSLYRAGAFIETFLANMTSQTIFDDCELIIIDAASPEGEHEAARDYVARHASIRYVRLPHWVGIYEAWNIGVGMATAPYLTNANLDDLRRHDSLELQASVLDALPFVDVVYQDFLVSFDAKASFAEITRRGIKSHLPVLTPNNLLAFNSPHNAPMWRRCLHDEVGLFDTSFESAGDYDFWARCAALSKQFYKLNDPHVSYYVNPEGLSTRPGTRGAAETHRIYFEQGPHLISPFLSQPFEEFCRACGVDPVGRRVRGFSRHEIAHGALLNVPDPADLTGVEG